jgi:hypothetical protein
VRTATHNIYMAHSDDSNLPELRGCPVMIANGLYQVNEKWPDVALRMLEDHLTDTTRTCCDQHGFALDPETGCTAEEMEHLACPQCQSREVRVYPAHDDQDRGVCHDCGYSSRDIEGDFLVKAKLPRIQAKPVRMEETAQGKLFDEKEVA